VGKKRILPQMFDVFPVDETGCLDWQKIESIGEIKKIQEEKESEALYLEQIDDFSELGDYDFENKIAYHQEQAEIIKQKYLEHKQELKKQEIARQESLKIKKEQLIYQENLKKQEKEKVLEQEIVRRELEKRNLLGLEKERLLQEEKFNKSEEERFFKQRRIREELVRKEFLRAQEEKIKSIQDAIFLQEKQQREKNKIEEQENERRQALMIQEQEEQKQEALRIQKEEKQRQENFRIQEEQRQREELASFQKQEEERLERIRIKEEQQKQERIKVQQEENLKNQILKEQKYNEQKELAIQKKFESGQIFWQKEKKFKKNKKVNFESKEAFSLGEILSIPRRLLSFEKRKMAFSFALMVGIVSAGILGISFIGRGMHVKGEVLGVSQDGYDDLQAAASSIMSKNFQASSEDFSKAYEKFSLASNDLDQMGSLLIGASRFIPFASKLSSGKNAVEAGKHISAAGKALNEVAKDAVLIKNPLTENTNESVSLLDSFKKTEKNIKIAQTELTEANKNINLIKIDDLPVEKQTQFLDLKEKLPVMLSLMNNFTNNSDIFTDILGGNGPRKYLFLFQNNSEMRATGGFIGTYGLLDISQGKIRKFFIDGIFNPDGQLTDNVVPPVPIQKVSGAWSLHDSNWFADFPVSAREAINFYERTGGPTVDGVITLTPTVMQKLLAITGPIEMKDYDVTLTAENFIEQTQYEVEVDYDKKENKPKKILSDLAPILLDKVLNTSDPKILSKSLLALTDGLREKHILIYSDNKDLQKIISAQGWSGEILGATKDYISVINTNINGFKTDSVVSEKIIHSAKIQNDGTVLDTVSITRKHSGGNLNYEWWNKVNADYMRVYVPLGSELKSVSGQTREKVQAPLDYDKLGFERDPLVQKEEDSIKVDQDSGTRIYAESGKTVFGNWVYVSPGESVTITYTYILPFKLFQTTQNNTSQIDSYSLVAQKQSGSLGSDFEFSLDYPAEYKNKWNFPENIDKKENNISYATNLKTDSYIGVAFEK
jgi:hypothetical protein